LTILKPKLAKNQNKKAMKVKKISNICLLSSKFSVAKGKKNKGRKKTRQ
jgi:hypothetical protein